jgi:hypothetical protein
VASSRLPSTIRASSAPSGLARPRLPPPDPAAAPVYVYGYVGDNEVPQVRVGQPMGVDGTVVEVVHDFAVGAMDFRGGFFNAGAAPT